MAFTVSEDDTSIKTILTIQNPSEFNFLVVYVSEKFYLYGTIVGKYDGYWNRSSENPLELHSFSSLDVIVNAKDVCSKEQMEDLHAVVTIGIETPLPDRIPLRFAEAFHDDA